MKIVFYLLLLSEMSIFSNCHSLLKKFNDYNVYCNGLAGSSSVSSIVGATFFPVFGGLLGLIPGIPALLVCNEKDRIKIRLDLCLQYKKDQNNAEIENQKKKDKKINIINLEFENQKIKLINDLKIKLKNLSQQYLEKGILISEITNDINYQNDHKAIQNDHKAIQNEFKDKIIELEKNHKLKLEQIK